MGILKFEHSIFVLLRSSLALFWGIASDWVLRCLWAIVSSWALKTIDCSIIRVPSLSAGLFQALTDLASVSTWACYAWLETVGQFSVVRVHPISTFAVSTGDGS